MPVVSNTSPIMNLAIIGQLDLLRMQFSRIVIPPAVLAELRFDTNLPGAAVVRQALLDNWITVQDIQDQTVVRLLQRELDRGEAEAIALAVQISAERILLDERDARRLAKSLDLPVTGVLGVVLRGYKDGQLTSLESTVADLEEKAGFWIAPDLKQTLLAQ
jgi:predicted nucleic acid-binding protein